jgi:hypothetical protein
MRLTKARLKSAEIFSGSADGIENPEHYIVRNIPMSGNVLKKGKQLTIS